MAITSFPSVLILGVPGLAVWLVISRIEFICYVDALLDQEG